MGCDTVTTILGNCWCRGLRG